MTEKSRTHSDRRRMRVVAVIGAAVASAVLYLIGAAFGVDYELGNATITVPEIGIAIFGLGLLGWGSLVLLMRYSHHAMAVWGRLAGAVLLVLFILAVIRVRRPGTDRVHHAVLPEIVGATLIFGLLGWASLVLLEQYVPRARTVWTVLAGGVLVLSAALVVEVHASDGTKTMLSLIHVSVAAVLIPLMRRSARPTSR
jgi:hypothetical protein